MSAFFAITVIVFLGSITRLLVDILGELRLAKKDREDDRSQMMDPKDNFDKEE